MMINGLKYLRTRCNYSQHELAEILDVTDAMISKWENDNKVISEERQEELAYLLGVPTSFLGQISEKQIEFINNLPMIRQDRKVKEHYRIDMSDDIRDGIWRHYFGKTERSLSDDYNQAKKLKKDTLEEIAETIGGDNTDRFGGIRGAINEIEKGCKRYSFMTRFLRHKNTVDRGLKAPYMFELLDVFYALELAFNMRPETEEEIERFTRIRGLRMIDEEYVRKLAIMIKEHWDLQKEYHIKEMEKWKEEDEAYE